MIHVDLLIIVKENNILINNQVSIINNISNVTITFYWYKSWLNGWKLVVSRLLSNLYNYKKF